MSSPALLLIVGFLYTLLVGGMALLRREGLSSHFAIEAIVITVLISGLSYLTGSPIHPGLLLVLLYLVTMRARLLVDLANFLAQRGRHLHADQLYQVAMRLWPDPTSRLVVLVNCGASLVQRGENDRAIQVFLDVLQKKDAGHLGLKYEAATHYNLGVAYRRKAMETQARLEFGAVIDLWPASDYARRAENALSQKGYKN